MNEIDTVENERIKPLITTGIAKIIDANSCKKFNEYLCAQYPWVGFSDRIDWDKVKKPFLRLDWQHANEEETTFFLKTTCLNNCDMIGIIYGAREKGLIVSFNYLCDHLENLVLFGWRTHFIVGARKNKYGIIELMYDCFVEVDFSDWLTASC